LLKPPYSHIFDFWLSPFPIPANTVLISETFFADEIFTRRSIKRFDQSKCDFKVGLLSYKYMEDWFTVNIPFWLLMIEEYGLQTKPTIDVLGIGGWEGCSSLFLLQTLQNTKITCVGMWEGSQQLVDFGALGTGKLILILIFLSIKND
jgi:hypothetical protein